MNPLSLGKAIVQNFLFMNALTRKLGAPVHLSKADCQRVVDDLKADKMMAQKFAFVYNIKENTLTYHVNTDRFLAYKGALDLTKFFLMIHPNYMEEYLKWGRAVYSYLMKQQHTTIEPLNQCTRITVPLKLADGNYHWVLQEALPLEIDAGNKLISHLNIYSVLKPMLPTDKEKISQRLYDKGFEATQWTKVVWKEFFTLQTFDLATEERRIVDTLRENPTFTNAQIAEKLGKSKNTIDGQNKKILEKAARSFAYETLESVREVVLFLEKIGYFTENTKNLP